MSYLSERQPSLPTLTPGDGVDRVELAVLYPPLDESPSESICTFIPNGLVSTLARGNLEPCSTDGDVPVEGCFRTGHCRVGLFGLYGGAQLKSFDFVEGLVGVTLPDTTPDHIPCFLSAGWKLFHEENFNNLCRKLSKG